MNSGAVSLELPGLFPEAGAGEQHMELCVMIPSVLLRGLCEQVHKGVSCADTKFSLDFMEVLQWGFCSLCGHC